MHLSELRVENFGPYLGAQSITFGSKRPVVIVHGDNMRGKTSLLNALRWVLYGEAPDRFGRSLPRVQLVNSESAERGNWTMSVDLKFDVDGVEYEVKRAIQPKVAGSLPRANLDFDENLLVRRNGSFIQPAEGQTDLNRILPKGVSNFFLFDGELLNKYERLLSDTDRDAQLIRESIEEILGVPALVHGIADLKVNLRDAARRQQSAAAADRQAQVYAAQAARYEGDIQGLEIDLGSLKERHSDWSREQQELAETLESMAQTEAELQRLQDVDDQIKKRKQDEELLAQQKRVDLALVWRDLMHPNLAAKLAALEDEQQSQITGIGAAANRHSERVHLERLRDTGSCEICGQALADIGAVERRLRELDQMAEVEFDQDRFSRISESIRKLRLLAPSNVTGSLIDIERRVLQNVVELNHLEMKQEEIRKRLGPADQSVVARKRWDYEQRVKQLGVLEAEILAKEAEISEKQRLAAENRAQIRRHSGPGMARLNREVELYEQMVVVFERTVVSLRDELKVSVERDASEIFGRLTTNKTYQGLRINDQYGLAIIDDRGKEVTVRSAGAEQIVALALLGALNRNAVRRGPVVMDTPFGRLDPKHRKNVLEFVPTMADQVALLVHGGELDRDRDLPHLAGNVDHEYQLEFVSSRETTIVPLKGGESNDK